MNRNTNTWKILAVVFLLGATMATTAMAASFTAGNLAISRVGDGTNPLVNTGGPVDILEVTTAGSVVQTISIPSGVGATSLQWSGTATSEGALTRSPDGTTLALTGYNNAPFTGAGSLSSRTAAEAPRAFGTVDSSGTYAFGGIFSGTGTNFSGNNVRSALTDGTNTWAVGGNSGTVLFSPSTTISTTNNVSMRVLGAHNGNLYFSTGSSTNGIYGLGAFPTSGPVTATLEIAVTNPYDFAFSPGPLVNGSYAYVATIAANGVQRFNYNGTTWTNAYNFTAAGNGLTGLAVDFSTNTIYSVSPTALFSVVDLGAGGTMTSVATAGTNYAFRGLEFAPVPVPEPSTLALLGAGAVGLLVYRSRRKA
jgi:hypothetical protein